MITRTTLWGPAGGKKKVNGIDKLNIDDAINLLRMDFDLGFNVIEITDTHVLIEYYEGEKYAMGTHKRYEGCARHMKKLVQFVRVRDTLLSPA